MSDAMSVLYAAVAREGWDEDTMLAIACAYIDNQHDLPTFMDFVAQYFYDDAREGPLVEPE